MATAIPSNVPGDPGATAPPPEARQTIDHLTVYSHSNLMYWWPVWLVCFILAGVTYAEGNQMAVVPDGTVSVSGATVTHPDYQFPGPRDVLVAPADAHVKLAPNDPGQAAAAPAGADPTQGKNRPPAHPSMTVSGNNSLGVVFATTLLVVAVVSTLTLRGLISMIVIILMVLTVVTLAFFGLWDDILAFFGGLDIRMNAAGYLFIGIPLALVWAFVFFVQDRMHYVTFDEGQIRYVLEIGDSAVVVSADGAIVEKRRSDVFRHWVLGLGTGDLVIRLPNGQEIDLPNITNANRKMTLIDTMLRKKSIVVEG